jgi:hypothetical protein
MRTVPPPPSLGSTLLHRHPYLQDFVQNFSGLANPLGNDPSSMLNTAPWMREPDHKEHIGL